MRTLIKSLLILLFCLNIKSGITQNMFRINPEHHGYCASGDIHEPIVKWKFKTDTKFNRSTPVIYENVVYVGSNDCHIYAIHLDTGELKWKFKTGGLVASSPAIQNNSVYFYSKDGYFYCLNIADGAKEWKLKIENNPGVKDQYDYFMSSPVLDDTVAYIGSDQGTVYCIHLTDHDTLWTYKTQGQVLSTPAVDENAVYFGSFDGYLYKLNKTTGELVWKFNAEPNTWSPKGEIQASPVLADSFVCFGSRGEYFYVIRKKDASLKWNSRSNNSWIVSSAAYHDGIVYYGDSDGHYFHARDLLTGEKKWDFNTGVNILSSPLLTDNSVYFATGNSYTSAYKGKIYSFDKITGSLNWNLTAGGNIWSSPAISDSIICFSCDDGYIYTLENRINSGVDELQQTGATKHSTLCNYPNPFNPSTTIRYTLNQPGKTLLSIYNIAGQKLEVLVNEYQTTGEYAISWQPNELSSAIYFYMLQTESFHMIGKMVFQK